MPATERLRGLLAGHCLGVLLIVLVACIWVAASQLITAIYQDLSFDAPYFLTYFNTCGFTLWLLGPLCSPRWRRELAVRPQRSHGGALLAETFGDEACGASSGAPREAGCPEEAPAACSGARRYISVALSISPGWMLANYLFNLSLDHTSVASNSVLSTTSNLWTMLFSVCFLGESVNPVKLLAVVLTIGGAALVSAADSGEVPQDGDGARWQGDAMALTSACMYGAYSVLLKYRVPDGEQTLSMPLVFGFVGLAVLLSGWPFLWFLDATSLERFRLPSARTLGFLSLNALVGTNLSDVLWAQALQLTTPLVATLGLSLTIPLGMLSDMVLHGKSFMAKYIVGAALVLAGFALGSLADSFWAALRRRGNGQPGSAISPSGIQVASCRM